MYSDICVRCGKKIGDQAFAVVRLSRFGSADEGSKKAWRYRFCESCYEEYVKMFERYLLDDLSYEDDGYFYLPKPKKPLGTLKGGEPEIKIESDGTISVKQRTSFSFDDAAINYWADSINDEILGRVAEVFSSKRHTCRNIAEEWHSSHDYGPCYRNTAFRCSNCGAYYYDTESYYAGLAVDDDEGYELSVPTNWCPYCGAKVVEPDGD